MRRYGWGYLWLFGLIGLPILEVTDTSAETLHRVAFQGRALGVNGEPLPQAAYRISFTLFDSETGGAELWTETHFTVAVADGLFTVSLGSEVPFPAGLFGSGDDLWLEMAIDVEQDGLDADDVHAPRTPLNAVPVAFQAFDSKTLEGEPASEFARASIVDASLAEQAAALSLKAVASEVYTQAQLDAQQAAQDDAIGLKANTSDVYIKSQIDSQQSAQDTAIGLKANTSDVYTKSQVDSQQTAQDDAISQKMDRIADSYVLVDTTNNAVQNGLNLLAAYAVASQLSPGGMPRSAENRTAVLIPPGRYDLGVSPLALQTDFVDLVGLSTVRDHQSILGSTSGPGTGVITQTALDVRIENLRVECNRSSGGLVFDSSDPAAYFPGSDLPSTLIRNCEFIADGANALSMRMGVTFSGTYAESAGGVFAFGGGGTASGAFIDCTGGVSSFGTISSGQFTRCVGDGNSFGGFGEAVGVYVDCTGGSNSFGGGIGTTTTGARLTRCRMTGDWQGTFRGRMEDCTWATGLTLGAAARLYGCTILGNLNLNGNAAGIAHCSVRGAIQNAASAAFNVANLESLEVN